MGILGATSARGVEGFGRSGKIDSGHFFDFTDQPIEVIMAMTEEQAAALLARLDEEHANVFYVKARWNTAQWDRRRALDTEFLRAARAALGALPAGGDDQRAGDDEDAAERDAPRQRLAQHQDAKHDGKHHA